jgi:hypothetical protein
MRYNSMVKPMGALGLHIARRKVLALALDGAEFEQEFPGYSKPLLSSMPEVHQLALFAKQSPPPPGARGRGEGEGVGEGEGGGKSKSRVPSTALFLG